MLTPALWFPSSFSIILLCGFFFFPPLEVVLRPTLSGYCFKGAWLGVSLGHEGNILEHCTPVRFLVGLAHHWLWRWDRSSTARAGGDGGVRLSGAYFHHPHLLAKLSLEMGRTWRALFSNGQQMGWLELQIFAKKSCKCQGSGQKHAPRSGSHVPMRAPVRCSFGASLGWRNWSCVLEEQDPISISLRSSRLVR